MLKNKDNSQIIFSSFFQSIVCEYSDLYSDEALAHACKFVNFNNIPNRVIFDNDRILKCLDWNSLEKMCLIRIIIACIDRDKIDVLSKVNFSGLKYKIKDIKFLIMRKPELIEMFDFDLNKIDIEDAYTLLNLGQEYFINKINIEKYDFSSNEIYEIIKSHKYAMHVSKRLKINKLKSNHIVEIILNSNNAEYGNILNLSLLNTLDWIRVLEKIKTLLGKCNLNIFRKSDIFDSIKLCEIFKNDNNDIIFNLIHKRDTSEITSFGWEKLIINNYNEFIHLLDYSKLNDLSIKNIRKHHQNFNS